MSLRYALVNNLCQVFLGEIDAVEAEDPGMKSISRPQINEKELENYVGK